MKISSMSYLIKEGFKNIWNNRMMSLASVVVLVSCLIITGSASLISVNMAKVISSVSDDNQITVYIKREVSDLDSIKMGSEFSKINNVETYRFRSRDDVLKDYSKEIGENLTESLTGKNSPFGNEYKLKLKDLSKYKETVRQLKRIEGVEKVSDRSEIAGRLTKLNYFVTIVGSWVVLILAVVTLFIISNTIKMTMYGRRYEISIMKSVGATNAFVRIPFVVEAMAIGLFSGLIASCIILSMYSPVRDALSSIVGMIKNSTYNTEEVWIPMVLSMSGIGMLIGIVGGFISITRYLKKEGGEILGW